MRSLEFGMFGMLVSLGVGDWVQLGAISDGRWKEIKAVIPSKRGAGYPDDFFNAGRVPPAVFVTLDRLRAEARAEAAAIAGAQLALCLGGEWEDGWGWVHVDPPTPFD